MNKTITVLFFGLLISGCSMIPSFWDDNESYLVASVRHKVDSINCNASYMYQAHDLLSEVRFLELYSESKGSDDLMSMVLPMKETITGLTSKEENAIFCSLKKKQLEKQSALIADAVMRRF